MNLSDQSQKILASALQTLVARYGNANAESVLTDFHFHPSRETGDLTITDDDGNVIACVNVVEWCDDTSDNFFDVVRQEIMKAINLFDAEGALHNLAVWKPYSLVLVDDDYETICDLLYVDDDTMVITDHLLKDLDEDLNNFLANLLGTNS